MLSLMTLLSFTTAMSVGSMNNPIKLSFTLMKISLVLFGSLMILSLNVWMGGIFLMVFIGGILIMFMMLSSLLPNEKSLKSKKNKMIVMMVMLVYFDLTNQMPTLENKLTTESKIQFFSKLSFETLMMVIIMYFLIFVLIISKEKSSLRTYFCQ